MGVFKDLIDVLATESHLLSCASLGATLLVTYWIVLGVYRLYFHPLAKFPGPKLAALTQWYETYYEFKPPGGQFMFQYRKLHEKYGPIVRISPFEIHIQDSEFYNEFFAPSRPWNKLEQLSNRFNNPLSVLSISKHEIHRRRRAALNPFFSKRKATNAAPRIQNLLYKLCRRLNQEYKGTGQIVTLDKMWGCLTSDTITTYCFDWTYNFIDAPGFQSSLVQGIKDLLENVHFATQFSGASKLLMQLPDALVIWLHPKIESVINFKNEMTKQIVEVLEKKRSLEKPNDSTVFGALLESDSPLEKLILTYLQHEAITLIGAGLETTRWALTVGSFHIINTPSVFKRLREELESAIPNPDEMLSLTELEKLPYLTACIEESFRMSYGVAQRIPRCSDTMSITYKEYVIPPGTVISMDNYAVSHDEAIFPNSHTFRPERWLDAHYAPDGKPLNRYMVSFGRGHRSCLGINLAYAEVYIAMANIYRNFEFELFETDRTAVDCYRVMSAPKPKLGTLGVRVLIK